MSARHSTLKKTTSICTYIEPLYSAHIYTWPDPNVVQCIISIVFVFRFVCRCGFRFVCNACWKHRVKTKQLQWATFCFSMSLYPFWSSMFCFALSFSSLSCQSLLCQICFRFVGFEWCVASKVVLVQSITCGVVLLRWASILLCVYDLWEHSNVRISRCQCCCVCCFLGLGINAFPAFARMTYTEQMPTPCNNNSKLMT